jgi:hypothetical protein
VESLGEISSFSKSSTTSLLSRLLLLLKLRWTTLFHVLGNAREEVLKFKACSIEPALDNGTNVVHHNNTVHSAQVIVYSIIQHVLQLINIQVEMLNEEMNVSEPSACINGSRNKQNRLLRDV